MRPALALLAALALSAADPPQRYAARADLTAISKTAMDPPAVGATFYDPDFGTQGVRVTGPSTMVGTSSTYLNRGFRTNSSAEANSWNSDGTKFYVLMAGGVLVPFTFNRTTMAVGRICATENLSFAGLALFGISPDASDWAYTNPDKIYGIDAGIIRRFNLDTYVCGQAESTGYTDILTPSSLPWSLTDNPISFSLAADDDQMGFVCCGSQDTAGSTRVIWYKASTATSHIVNFSDSTIDGVACCAGALSGTLHNARIMRDGAGFVITRTGGQLWYWDIAGGTATQLTGQSDGHKAQGYSYIINSGNPDPVTDNGPNMWRRDTSTLGSPVRMLPQHATSGYHPNSHWSWNNARNGTIYPAIGATYMNNQGTSNQPLLNEVIGITLDQAADSAIRYRFAYTRNYMESSDSDNFNYQVIGSVGDGRFYLYTSNWEKAMGNATDGKPRYDVFIVRLNTIDVAVTAAERGASIDYDLPNGSAACAWYMDSESTITAPHAQTANTNAASGTVVFDQGIPGTLYYARAVCGTDDVRNFEFTTVSVAGLRGAGRGLYTGAGTQR